MLRLGLAVRVIMRRRHVGVSLSWLMVILLFPFLGALIYLIIGENRVGLRRGMRAERLTEHFREWQKQIVNRLSVNWDEVDVNSEAMRRQIETSVGLPAIQGNDLKLFSEWNQTLRSIIRDIEDAEGCIHMLFYIWSDGGIADEVAEALMRASQRGVTCRLLVDAVGSQEFIRGEMIGRMRESGIDVVEALPVGIFRLLLRRIDLRNHRKLVVIDGKVGYTGSQNLADARFFKQDEGVGQWVDAMVRITGPMVEVLGVLFLGDWILESEDELEEIIKGACIGAQDDTGDITAQVVPSGPGYFAKTIHEILLTTIYSAREQLIITTPYFVPDESLLSALIAAAHRGVEVILIVPRKGDSWLVEKASRSYYIELLEAGIKVYPYKKGLLHTKSVTVDGNVTLIGTFNMDMRSFWINFELTLFVYDRTFTEEMRNIQMSYLEGHTPLQYERWSDRPFKDRFIENSARLLSPLL